MYPGPDLPAGDVATVTGFFERHRLIVTLKSVDGIAVPNQSRLADHERKTTAIVTPGVHVVEFEFLASRFGSSVYSKEPMSLTFNMERGHHYEIRVGRDPGDTDTALSILAAVTIGSTQQWNAWVVDLGTDPGTSRDAPPSNYDTTR